LNKIKVYYKKITGGAGRADSGSSLIEALISLALISFVVVSIMSGVSQQQVTNQNNTDKNSAIMLAEMRLEELGKFNADQLAEEVFVDHIIAKDNGFEVFGEGVQPPNVEKLFRRTTTVSKDLLQQVAIIRVEVEYGAYFVDKYGSELIYPAQVAITTRRAL
jgi:type II secretory pathway pseudopilin PulG